MKMKNIELFDGYTAEIFAGLYRTFPIKGAIDARNLSGHFETDEFGTIINGKGAKSHEFEVARSTIEWLYDTGYIRGDEPSEYGISRAVLSPMGLAVLKAAPESLSASSTVGERLSQLLQSGATDAAKDLIKTALASGITASIKAGLT